MRILVIGAGASYQEGISLGLPSSKTLPLLNELAKKLWPSGEFEYVNRNHSILIDFYIQNKGAIPDLDLLKQLLRLPEEKLKISYKNSSSLRVLGNIATEDITDSYTEPIERFIELERNPENEINIERFFEFLWRLKLLDPKVFSPIWHNFVLWNLRQPLEMIILEGFINKDAFEMLSLPAATSVGSILTQGDIVLNLNYDTLLELGLEQLGKTFGYVPWEVDRNKVSVAKPHGSMNMAYDTINRQYVYSQPFCFGKVPGGQLDLTLALVPPRLNKSYDQNWFSKDIFKAIKSAEPTVLTFWGIGLTDSDIDLVKLFRNWSCRARKVEFINPSEEVLVKAQRLLKRRDIKHFKTLDSWLVEQNTN